MNTASCPVVSLPHSIFERTQNARQFKPEQTPLQRDVNRLLRILLLIVVFFTVVLFLALWVMSSARWRCWSKPRRARAGIWP